MSVPFSMTDALEPEPDPQQQHAEQTEGTPPDSNSSDRDSSLQKKEQRAADGPAGWSAASSGSVCAICLGDMATRANDTVLLPGCGHRFHAACAAQWISHSIRGVAEMRCPLCRTAVAIPHKAPVNESDPTIPQLWQSRGVGVVPRRAVRANRYSERSSNSSTTDGKTLADQCKVCAAVAFVAVPLLVIIANILTGEYSPEVNNIAAVMALIGALAAIRMCRPYRPPRQPRPQSAGGGATQSQQQPASAGLADMIAP